MLNLISPDHYLNFLVIKMERIILENLQKDKMLVYLKENSYFIKNLNRNPNFYPEFKKIIKEKYNLRFTDKVSDFLNDMELVSSIISTLE